MKGHFITLEGGEGSGKTTLLERIAQHLTVQGYQVTKTREPGGSQLGEAIRQWLLQKNSQFSIGHQAELLLFLAARAQHIEEVIGPALEKGKIVLCDRFNDSTIAYQGAARGLQMQYVQQLCQLVCGPIEPHLTLFLDVKPKVGLLRTKALVKEHALSGEFDRIETERLEFHEKVRQGFLTILKQEPLRVYRLDANRSPHVVFKEAIRAIDELILLPAKHNR